MLMINREVRVSSHIVQIYTLFCLDYILENKVTVATKNDFVRLIGNIFACKDNLLHRESTSLQVQ